MPSVPRLSLILAAPLALAACGGNAKKEKDQRTAAGEILPGSISDAMLPYDTVRSQPPLAPKETGKPGAKGAVDLPDAAASEPAVPGGVSSDQPAEVAASPASTAE